MGAAVGAAESSGVVGEARVGRGGTLRHVFAYGDGRRYGGVRRAERYGCVRRTDRYGCRRRADRCGTGRRYAHGRGPGGCSDRGRPGRIDGGAADDDLALSRPAAASQAARRSPQAGRSAAGADRHRTDIPVVRLHDVLVVRFASGPGNVAGRGIGLDRRRLCRNRPDHRDSRLHRKANRWPAPVRVAGGVPGDRPGIRRAGVFGAVPEDDADARGIRVYRRFRLGSGHSGARVRRHRLRQSHHAAS